MTTGGRCGRADDMTDFPLLGPRQTFRNVSSYVGCSGWSGLVMLGVSYSGFDPKRTETLEERGPLKIGEQSLPLRQSVVIDV